MTTQRLNDGALESWARHLASAVFWHWPLGQAAAVARRVVLFAHKDVPPCDYTVPERPDVLDGERDNAVRALAEQRAHAIYGGPRWRVVIGRDHGDVVAGTRAIALELAKLVGGGKPALCRGACEGPPTGRVYAVDASGVAVRVA